MENLSDIELISLCKSGSERAFETLYERYRQTVVNFAYQILKDKDLSLDALQETFVYVFKKMPEYQPAAKLSTLLFTVTRNICLNMLSKTKCNKSIPNEEMNGFIKVKEPVNSIELVEKEELKKTVAAELDNLPDIYREVIILKILKGMQYDEISQVVGCPIGTVKSRLHNALEYLRNNLAKKGEEKDLTEPKGEVSA
ncbi:MAG: RNA polymerase sigma factor [Planctomycetes bacterium]|nr:RNA polymerase sigma factor [Planctomycetota bacterium]